MEDSFGLLSGKEIKWRQSPARRRGWLVAGCVCFTVVVSAVAIILWRPVRKPTPGIAVCSRDIRLDAVHRFCNEHEGHAKGNKLEHRNRYRHILVDDEHRMLYCAVPGTRYGPIVTLLANDVEPSDNYSALTEPGSFSNVGLRSLNTFSLDDIHDKLTNYYSFLMVVHPFIRLESAFIDMFVSGTEGTERYERPIREFYDRTKPNRISEQPKITFYQFLELVVGSKGFQDDRWKTCNSLCHPCDISYDVILKLETIESDFRFIQDRLGDQSSYDAFWNVKSLLNINITNKVFHTVPHGLLDQILKHYKKDFRIFGYQWDVETGLQCNFGKGTQHKCC